MNDGDYNQAFQSLARRENLPAALTSDEWASVPTEIRQRAFFMSRVTDAEILQRFRQSVDEVTKGTRDRGTASKELQMWLKEYGYTPPAGKEGSLQDLSSLDRVNVVLSTNLNMARGHAQWVRDQTAIRAFPARRFFRLTPKREPRDWETRWAMAKSATASIPGVHPTEKVALTNHPIWAALSRFNQPWAPFDFGSGMDTKLVSRRGAKALGLPLDPNNNPMQQPVFKSMNDGLMVTPAIIDGDLREHIGRRMGRLAQWDGDKLIFTDPDGSKPYTAKALADLWAKPAPPEFDILTQRDALATWKGGLKADRQDDRVTLRKLFDRIETESVPAQLYRAFRLAASDVSAFIRGLYQKVLTIPANVAGWDFVSTITEANRVLGEIGDGWKVLVNVRNGTNAIDISALRPGKPGFVYVGGKEFKVAIFSSDKGKRSINIVLEEIL